MDFQLTVLGSSGAVPAWGRFPSAQVLRVGHKVYLIDCGEGAQMRMQQLGVRPSRIKQVFISHLHGDHILGLMGLLQSMSLMGREQPLTIFSPPGLRQMIEAFQQALSGKLRFDLQFVALPLNAHEQIFEDGHLSVWSFPLKHHHMTVGYLFREKVRARKMRPECISRYQIPFTDIPAIKAGSDWVSPQGQRLPNTLLTKAPPPLRSYAYCCDTAWEPKIVPYIAEVDLLYHDATFSETHAAQAAETQHSTARQAADIARRARAGALVLGHFSARYPDINPLVEEAREVFPNVWAGLDGTSFSLDFRSKTLSVTGPGRELVWSGG